MMNGDYFKLLRGFALGLSDECRVTFATENQIEIYSKLFHYLLVTQVKY